MLPASKSYVMYKFISTVIYIMLPVYENTYCFYDALKLRDYNN
jgi:hypothetical protein